MNDAEKNNLVSKIEQEMRVLQGVADRMEIRGDELLREHIVSIIGELNYQLVELLDEHGPVVEFKRNRYF